MNMNAQELIETLEWRYATKVFNPDRRIPAEDWEALLESLHLSPSSDRKSTRLNSSHAT